MMTDIDAAHGWNVALDGLTPGWGVEVTLGLGVELDDPSRNRNRNCNRNPSPNHNPSPSPSSNPNQDLHLNGGWEEGTPFLHHNTWLADLGWKMIR